MYESFYGLKDKPFSMLPDPGFLYLSKKHRSALTMLEYALYNNAGFCVITGDIGAGKTTLLRKLLGAMEDNVTVGMITNTHQSFGELLDWVLSAFDIHKPGLNKVEMHQAFVDFLLQQYARQKTTLLIVDEAQNMQVETLEELRMLSNINSGKDQLLQIILAGQPELKETLRKPELKQFVQRIAVDYHLGPLNLEETFGYIQHRLITAGAKRNVFTPLACQRIFEYSNGIPRLINLLCDTAMVYGFADHTKLIGENLVDEMVHERMADSLVPIARGARPAKQASIPSPKQDSIQQSTAQTLTPGPRLTQVSPEPKNQAARTVMETAPSSSGINSVMRGQAQARQVPLDAAEALADADAIAAGAVVEVPEASVSEEQSLDPSVVQEAGEVLPADDVVSEDLKALFEFEAELLTEAEAGSSSQEKQADEQASSEQLPPTRQRVENRIEVIQGPVVTETKFFDKWTIIALIVLTIVVLYLVFPGSAELFKSLAEPKSEAQSGSEPTTELPADVKQKLEEAEILRQELERVQQQEQASREKLEAETRALQQQRDEAITRAEQEKEARLQKAEEADKAAAKARELEAKQARLKSEMKAAKAREAKALERQRQADLEASQKRAAEEELKQAIAREEQHAQELEAEWRKAQILVQPADQDLALKPEAIHLQTSAAEAGTKSESDKNTNMPAGDPDSAAPEFVMEACRGPSARFLSTCRR